MENKNAAFSEDTSKAIMDMLVRNSAQICVMQEQIKIMLSIIGQSKLEQVQKGTDERFVYHATRLKEAIFANYGELDIQDLLGE